MPRSEEDEIAEEAAKQSYDLPSFLHKVEQIQKQRATLTPTVLKRQIDSLTIQNAGFGRRLREVENRQTVSATESSPNLNARLLSENQALKRENLDFKKRLQDQDVKIANLTESVTSLQMTLTSVQAEVMHTDAANRQLSKQVSELEKNSDSFEERIFGDKLPELNFVTEKKNQGGYVFDYVNYPTLGPVVPVSKFVKWISEQWVCTVYPDDKNAATIARIDWDSLSVDQKLNLIVAKIGWFDEPYRNDQAPPITTKMNLPKDDGKKETAKE